MSDALIYIEQLESMQYGCEERTRGENMSKTNGVRPIDANAVLDAMPKSDVLLRHQVVDAICDSPSIDVVPVVHGDFEKYPEEVILNLRVTPFLCKTCRTTFITLNKEGKRFMFCSYCGAKMDGGKDENED